MKKTDLRQDYEVIIRPQNKAVSMNFGELWRYKDLIILFVKRNFSLMYKQTILGPVWLILNPLLTSVVFTVVFGSVAGISTDGTPQFLFYLAGSTIWGLFNSAVSGTSNTFLSNAGIFGKVYFPRLTVPISQAFTSITNFGIQFLMLMIFYVYFAIRGETQPLNWALLALPILVLQAAILGMGVGIIISSMTTKYRDLAIGVSFGMQLWMYATPVVYPMSSTGGIMKTVLLINPVTAIINNFKYALLGSGEFYIWEWAISGVISVLILFSGIKMYNKIEKNFVDTI